MTYRQRKKISFSCITSVNGNAIISLYFLSTFIKYCKSFAQICIRKPGYWLPSIVWLPTFFKIFSFVFNSWKTHKGLEKTWGWLIDETMLIFGWTIHLKGQLTKNVEICHNFLTLMRFQTCMTRFFLWVTQNEMFSRMPWLLLFIQWNEDCQAPKILYTFIWLFCYLFQNFSCHFIALCENLTYVWCLYKHVMFINVCFCIVAACLVVRSIETGL